LTQKILAKIDMKIMSQKFFDLDYSTFFGEKGICCSKAIVEGFLGGLEIFYGNTVGLNN